jgi:tetratricopeptide (TPR) repeat protein
MSDIFISYAREDRDKAELLARAFKQQEWAVWWDKVIPPGRKYADVISEELLSAKAVIVLWSQASVASDWVKDEAQEGANRRILVPVLVEKVNPPYGFRQVQTADLSDWDGSTSHAELQSLVRGIGSLIKQPVNDSALSIGRTASDKRRLLFYLLAGGVLVLLLGYGAYRLRTPKGTAGNPNQVANGTRGANNQNLSSLQTCDSESRHKAADFTSKGLMMIDPGGNHNAAALQFKEAISECPDYSEAYFWRGQSFVALQQNENAVADFKKVVEITTDADMRRKAQKFIADIESPIPTPTTVVVNTNTNAGANANLSPTHIVHAQVNEMFADDKSTRIAATTRLIIEKKHDAATVRVSVKSALAHPENKSGVINTLVYLENVDPAILKQNKSEIEALLAASKDNGAQTADHIRKVRGLLNE